MKIYPEKIWIDVDSRDKPFILHNEVTMGMCAYIRSDLAETRPTPPPQESVQSRAGEDVEELKSALRIEVGRVDHFRKENIALRAQIEIYKAANKDELQ